MSDDSSGGLTCIEVIIVVLIILGCVGIGPCAFMRCDSCNPVDPSVTGDPNGFLEDTTEESTDSNSFEDNDENREALEKLEKKLGN